MKLFRPVKGEEGKDWRMTQPFGTRPEVYGPMGFKGHMGLDYAGPKPGDMIPVYSSTAGICDVVEDEKNYGKHVKITSIIDGKPYTLLYGHLSEIHVKDNEEVKALQQIGVMGTTGFSSGVHLHWEIKDPTLANNGYKGRFDPLPFVCKWDDVESLHPIDKLWDEMNPYHFWNDYADKTILTGGQLRKMQDIFAHNFLIYLKSKQNQG